MSLPRVAVLDVNETLSDLRPLDERFAAVGLSGRREAWFAAVLRDGFALSLVGGRPVFRDVGAAVLGGMLSEDGRDGPAIEAAVRHVLAGMPQLPLHPDVAPGLRRLHAAGVRLVSLTNGATAMSDALFEDGGLLDLVEHRLSVEEVGPWKPHPATYDYALRTADVAAADAMMVAVHPWDLQGAHVAGLRTAWVRRRTTSWPACFADPDLSASGVDHLADLLDA